MKALADDLQRWLKGEPVLARREQPSAVMDVPRPRRFGRIILVAAAVVALLVWALGWI
jgi:hypothetical protein